MWKSNKILCLPRAMQERLISNQAKFQNYSEKSGGKASGKMTRKASENILSDQTEDYTFPRTFPSAFLTFWPFLGGRGRKWDFGFFVLFLLDNTSIGGPQVQWPTTPKNRKLKPDTLGNCVESMRGYVLARRGKV